MVIGQLMIKIDELTSELMVLDVYCNGKPVGLILIVVVNKHYQAIKFPVTNRCLPGSLTIEAVFDGY